VLINCVAYENGVRLADLTVEEISDYLEQPGCFVWVALRDTTPEELDKMKEEFNLHELAVEDARHGHQRPKLEEYDELIFIVMHLLEPDKEENNLGEVHVFVGPNYVLSVRNRSRQHFLGVRERCEREPHLLKEGPGFVLYALMDAVVDRYFPIIDQLESELEEIEEQIFTKKAARSNIEQLYGLKRKTMVLKHVVAPLMEVAGKLSGNRAPAVCFNIRDYFRDVYDHLLRIDSSIDTIRDTIGTAIQVNLSIGAIENNEISKRLAAWAGIFAVATALAGIWGMNFEHMPELKWEYGYPIALLTICSACFFLYIRLKRIGWL
jgi:magnesium transporter